MSDFGKVAVLMGGKSAEREISLLSGNAVLAALKRKGVDAHAFDPAAHPIFDLAKEQYTRAFIALHGRHGEDGTVQGALELMEVPYTGSGVMASALCMDKLRTKLVWRGSDVPVPRHLILTAASDWRAVARELGLPLVIKPAREGSSIGITKVAAADELEAAYELAARHDTLVLAEEFIAGRELTAAFLGDRVLPLIRIEAPGGNYDYHHKYFSDDTQYHCPCGLPASEEEAIQTMVMGAIEALDCRGWGRADLMLRDDGAPFLFEMNTVPGMTAHSLVPMAARAAGIGFDDLVLRILELADVG
ncbi:MAG TPA: D-alanine--D-alanine ligase [Burkholderiales bacterium]|nr:D-alanine--D-alanine ligase [Burkholderiales bacterium]